MGLRLHLRTSGGRDSEHVAGDAVEYEYGSEEGGREDGHGVYGCEFCDADWAAVGGRVGAEYGWGLFVCANVGGDGYGGWGPFDSRVEVC